MRYFILAILLMFVTTFVGCGSSPKLIEEKQLERIITEAMITTAIIDRTNIKTDTIDSYAAILKREGVTMADVKYTVMQMAGRKSNPLNNMFNVIKDKIDSVTKLAVYKFKVKSRYDSMAIAYAIDTIYHKDTVLKASPAKFKANLTSVQEGSYNIEFDYQSNKLYDIGVPMLKVYLASKGVNVDKSAWINRTATKKKFSHTIQVPKGGYDTLSIGFTEPSKKAGVKVIDSSYIENITVLYNPPVDLARRKYFEYITNIKTEIDYVYKNDSLFTRFGTR